MRIEITGDGSCLGNPGPGGWAVIVSGGATPVTLSGGEDETTNNRMEVTAMIRALAWVAQNAVSGDEVLLRFDSQYALKGAFEWLEGWKRRGWKKSDNKPVENADLWSVLDDTLRSARQVGAVLIPVWVRGHDGDLMNEEADRVAKAEAAARGKGHDRTLPEAADTAWPPRDGTLVVAVFAEGQGVWSGVPVIVGFANGVWSAAGPSSEGPWGDESFARFLRSEPLGRIGAQASPEP